jgi:hypothetical protein
MKEKVQYYKNLCKTILKQKNKHLEKIESINEVLFTNKLTTENLQTHKKLIQDLLCVINEKREEIYLMQSQVEIFEREINFWVYDFDSIKINPDIRVLYFLF